jgi:4-diphosphocytidyl-2-C-methyl-D-erythritol kinase
MPPSTWKDRLYNDFELSLFPKFPVLGEIKSLLYSAGAFYASMSGSGSTVFGLFNGPPQIEPPAGVVKWEGWI